MKDYGSERIVQMMAPTQSLTAVYVNTSNIEAPPVKVNVDLLVLVEEPYTDTDGKTKYMTRVRCMYMMNDGTGELVDEDLASLVGVFDDGALRDLKESTIEEARKELREYRAALGAARAAKRPVVS